MNPYEFNNAKFQYLLSSSKDERFSNDLEINNGLTLSYTKETSIAYSEMDQKLVLIVGLCIDAYSELARDSIAHYLCENVNDFQDLTKEVGRLAGKYIIVYQNKGNTYLIGDASGSLPIYYYSQNRVCFSSSEYIISSFLGLEESLYSLKIESFGAVGIGLPYNLTRYEDLSFLLPNHYIEMISTDAVSAKRYHIQYNAQKRKDYNAILNQSIFLIKNIVKEYSKYYDLVCPLTAGWDSRVILAFLLDSTETECYTFDHNHFNKNTAETRIPQRICNDLKITYNKIKVRNIPLDLISHMDTIIGSHQLKSRLNLAYTIKESFGNKAIIEGSIVGHIGKSGVFNAVPDWLECDNYFFTKTHNFSKEGKKETAEYLKILRNYTDKNKLYDLFALEIRCGRWGNQSSEVYSSLGVNMLNIFNNSELIMLWMEVDRLKRTQTQLHTDFLNLVKPKLLSYQFNPDEKNGWIKKNNYLFYSASFVKHFYQKYRLGLNNFILK